MAHLLTSKFALSDSRLKLMIILGSLMILIFLSNYVLAADLLAGTDADLKDTMKGTGKNWIYWIDGGVSLAMFAYTKKPFVFFSVLGVSLFITALLKLAGG